MKQHAFELEDSMYYGAFEERYILSCTKHYFKSRLHTIFEWDDDIHYPYLDAIEKTFLYKLDNLNEDTLLAYTFQYEYRLHEEDADLLPNQMALSKIINYFTPDQTLFRPRIRLFVPFTGTELATNKVYNNRLLLSFMEDAFVNEDDALFETNFSRFWPEMFSNPKFFRINYVSKKKHRLFKFSKLKVLYPYYDSFLKLYSTPHPEFSSYIAQRKLVSTNYDPNLFSRKDYLQYRREILKMRIKFHAIHNYAKPDTKGKWKLSPLVRQEVDNMKLARKEKKKRIREEKEEFKEVFGYYEDQDDTPWYNDDYYDSEFINPHSRG